MTNRERIVGTLLGRETDRAPYGVGIGFWPWGETLERWRAESGITDLDVPAELGFDAGFLRAPVESGAMPHFEERVLEEDEEFIVSVDARGVVMRNRRDAHSMPEWISHPVKTEDDWRRYKEEHLLGPVEDRLAGLGEFVALAARTDAPVQVGHFPWGVLGSTRDLMGAEEILVGFYDTPDMIRDMMRTWTDVWLGVWERVAEVVQIDHIHIWEDMCGRQGALISMGMVEEFMMPQYDRIAEFARTHSVPLVSVDSDGLVDELVPVVTRHGVNVFFPFEVQAGSDIEEFRRTCPELGIMGGLDKRALARGKPEMHVELGRAERMLAAGRYIPMFDHTIPPNVPWENFRYFCGELRQLCGA